MTFKGPAPDAPFRRSPRCSDTSDEPENLSYAKHSILSDKLLTAYTRHGVDAVVDRLSAGGLDRRQPIGEHHGQDIDHLPIAVIDAGELAPYLDLSKVRPPGDRKCFPPPTSCSDQVIFART